ncbi:hypothetical protein B566_EDAN009691 [Ephemera danica]|nr:hypothetical protein B566_EDAN009691 [Ephemera danica]
MLSISRGAQFAGATLSPAGGCIVCYTTPAVATTASEQCAPWTLDKRQRHSSIIPSAASSRSALLSCEHHPPPTHSPEDTKQNRMKMGARHKHHGPGVYLALLLFSLVSLSGCASDGKSKVNFREKEKQVLDQILGPGRYDARIRPSGVNGTGKSQTFSSLSRHFAVIGAKRASIIN